MKILVTGANGLLGQKLVKLLHQQQDVELLATSRGSGRFSEKGVAYASLDIENRENVQEVINRFKPHAIIHTAAMTNVDTCEQEREACWRANVTAVENLVEAAEAQQSFFVHLSTDFIFSGDSGPYSEEAEAAPVNHYGESKLAAEKVVQASKTPWAIVRTVLVYGITPGMSRSNIILWVKNGLESGKTLQIVDDQLRSPTLAEDLAEGCLLVAKNRAEGIWHISGKEMLTPYDMAIKTADFFQLDKSLINRTDSTQFTQPAKRPPKTGFIITKAVERLGYKPHSFEEGIALLAEQLNQDQP
ncbi:SDR family oxidoreductase [Nafulsella turpanensis]|uniref:SDR family oxidoreductase n=1 Tax=Nafulsella turpanensis TaxID=1265690 RepID=UPI0003457925|nr:SDR family oxidoreductase [Nafulsella turpanensis]